MSIFCRYSTRWVIESWICVNGDGFLKARGRAERCPSPTLWKEHHYHFCPWVLKNNKSCIKFLKWSRLSIKKTYHARLSLVQTDINPSHEHFFFGFDALSWKKKQKQRAFWTLFSVPIWRHARGLKFLRLPQTSLGSRALFARLPVRSPRSENIRWCLSCAVVITSVCFRWNHLRDTGKICFKRVHKRTGRRSESENGEITRHFNYLQANMI